MSSKAYLFGLDGNIIDEIDRINFKRSYKLNAVDTASFAFPSTSSKALASLFNFGFYLAIFDGNGIVPPWGGRYDPDRGWDADTFTSTAYSGEDQFNIRTGGNPTFLPYVLANPAGTTFRALINAANSVGDTLLRPGNIYEGGDNTTTELSPITYLMTNINQLVRQSKHDWGVAPVVTDNKLTLAASWYKRRGRVLARGLNDRNCEIKQDSLKEVGPIFNRIIAYGTGDTYSARPLYVANDLQSQAKYGVRVKPLSVNSDSGQTVQNAGLQELARLAWPRKNYKAKIQYDPDVAELLEQGNTMPFDNPKSGFGVSGKVGSQQIFVRLMAMAYKDGDPDIEATIQETTL
jgi:hypothetical protein